MFTVPLPNDFSPTIVARPLSCSAADSTSEPLALNRFRMITTGMFVAAPPCVAVNVVFVPSRSCSVRIVPLSRNSSATSFVVCSRPPGLFRRSRISPFLPLETMSFSAFCISSAVGSLNSRMWM